MPAPGAAQPAKPTQAAKPAQGGGPKAEYRDRDKPIQIRESNISAAKAVADAIRTSLGPRGMDKMIQSANGDVVITNDGATILNQMQLLHPAAKMLVELSKAQDVEAGDGTTTVVVLAGSLLDAASKLLARGIHPTAISESFQSAAEKCCEILKSMAIPVDLNDRQSLLNIATTSLNSKVVCQNASVLAPIAVDAVLKVTDPAIDQNVDLKDIKIVKKLGGTVEDTELVEGIVFTRKAVGLSPISRVEKAKVGLCQFQLSPPKTDMENQVIIHDYMEMDRAMKEERQYLLNIVKTIKKSGCNVLLMQKSILRDALTDMSLHFLNKMKIMVIDEIERDDVDFITRTVGCRPIVTHDHFIPEMLGYADLVEETLTGDSKVVRVTGGRKDSRTVTVLIRGSNNMVLEEAERSIHDALCVIRCLVKERAMIAGGGAPEIEMALKIRQFSQSLTGIQQYCFANYADALEVVPFTLAENAGLSPIETVTTLRNLHANGHRQHGVNVRKGCATDILEENVIQPLLVSLNAIKLATETVCAILKIDDVVNSAR